MRKVIMINRTSIDGYFASDNQQSQGMDWFVHDPQVDAAVHKPVKSDTLVLGYRTFALFEQAWMPYLVDPKADPNMKAVALELTRMKKLVFTRQDRQTSWENTTFLREDPGQAVSRLAAGNGSDILILGSGSIVAELARNKLINEFIFIVSPVISGRGKAMFAAMDTCRLGLVSSERFDSGNVVLHYRTL